jgi:hypothetical protein
MTTGKFNIASAFILQPLDRRILLMFAQCLAIRDRKDFRTHFTVHHVRYNYFGRCPLSEVYLMHMVLRQLAVLLLPHEWLSSYCET